MAFKSNRNKRHLNCKECGTKVYNVGDNAVAVTCSSCVQKSLGSCSIQEETGPSTPKE